MITVQKTARFPSGWLAAGLLAASGVLWAVMFFGTLAHLQRLAGGLAPFDIRPRGYGYEDARAFLAAIGPQGRAYYLDPELVLDSVYPPLYALSRAAVLWWLTMPGRLRDAGVPLAWRWALVAVPVVMAVLDGGIENVCIAEMLRGWPALSPDLVRLASLATQAKLLLGAFTEMAMAALAVAAALRWAKRRRA